MPAKTTGKAAAKKAPAKKAAPAADAKATKADKKETSAKKPKESKGKDEFGFNIGSKRSETMKMLKTGKHTIAEITEKLAPLTKTQVLAIASIGGKEVKIGAKDKASI